MTRPSGRAERPPARASDGRPASPVRIREGAPRAVARRGGGLPRGARYDRRVQVPLVRGLGEVVRGFPRPRPGRAGDPGWFGPGSVAWRVNAETVLLLGGGRALLMQVAHPLVAAGVADHSDFTREPFERLWRTVDAALTVVFGDSDQAAAAVERVNAIHRGVRGERGGRPYSALDPELLLWVHATLVDSSVAAYERFVGPLRAEERERYYLEMTRMGTALGIPGDLHPPTYRDFTAYLDRAVAELEVGEESRRVAREVLSPPAPLVLLPLGLLSGLLSVGLLPARIRRGLGLRWGPGAARAFEAASAAIRGAVPLLPDRLRRWPHAREAERRAGAGRPLRDPDLPAATPAAGLGQGERGGGGVLDRVAHGLVERDLLG